MKNRYRLVGLGDDQLLAALPVLVQRGNENTADVLAHLAELDERKLYLDLGYASLFAYCIELLGLCESAAGRRTTAARVCRRFPDAFARVARGELHLSALCAMSPHLNSENAAELFDACSHRTRRQVEEALAKRFPRADVRAQLRSLPGGLGLDPLSDNRYGVHFTADGEFRDLLEKARALTSHRIPAGDLAGLMKLGLEALIRETEKKRFAVGRKAKAHPPGGRDVEGRRSRHVPAAVARAIYLRDDGRCTFVAQDGKRCAARDFVEIDHIDPFATGGQPTVENLRLRCRAHNQQHARKYFGKGYIQAAIARGRRDRHVGDPQQTGSGPARNQNGAHASTFGG
ncbi:MAG TPA: HNH endonuclease signature motif containing protein [Polyangiaceae bacterium]